jgi:hypothetical protein
VTCAICGIRKPRRYCPGVLGNICTTCCGTGREQTIDCPLGCEYLREAHLHEKLPERDPDELPNSDIRISDSFLEENYPLLMLLGHALAKGALTNTSVTDFDAREALESLIRTYRTLQSGLYYDSVPSNPFAAEIFRAFQSRVEEVRQRETEARGSSTLRDSTILVLLVALQRLEFRHNNGRKRSRAFLDFLLGLLPLLPEDTEAVEPESPRIIL